MYAVKGTHRVVIKKHPLSELRGFLKGKVWMADDFNAPLDEMKEYME